jgi:NAD(P)-dependent dehydrogenase (short-subunit alcohol dehydrogenase family)
MFTTSGRATRAEDCVPGLIAYSAAKMAQVGLMVGLAAELHDTDIRVNAVSPVAATRVLRRNAPELRLELVAPGVAFLASSACGISAATDRRIMIERRHSLRQSLHIDASGRRSYRRRGPRSPTGVQLFCKGEVR